MTSTNTRTHCLAFNMRMDTVRGSHSLHRGGLYGAPCIQLRATASQRSVPPGCTATLLSYPTQVYGAEELTVHKWPVRLLERNPETEPKRIQKQRCAVDDNRAVPRGWLPGKVQAGGAQQGYRGPTIDLQVLEPRKETLALASCRKKAHSGPDSTKSRRMQTHAAWMPLDTGELAGANSTSPGWARHHCRQCAFPNTRGAREDP